MIKQKRKTKLSEKELLKWKQQHAINLIFSEHNTYLASEESLKKEWLLPEEDEAWNDL